MQFKHRIQVLSRHGLQEGTVELSLAAEALREALAAGYAAALADHLMAERCAALPLSPAP